MKWKSFVSHFSLSLVLNAIAISAFCSEYRNEKFGITIKTPPACAFAKSKNVESFHLDGLVDQATYKEGSKKRFTLFLTDFSAQKYKHVDERDPLMETQESNYAFIKKTAKSFQEFSVNGVKSIAYITCGSAACSWEWTLVVDKKFKMHILYFDSSDERNEIPFEKSYVSPPDHACSVLAAIKSIRF